ncbi:MAG: hypothetical protein GC200_03775 [Tepidisphaera sp.]|nr:hypothetical protein [Tepidisphaera sp.]
MDRVLTRRVRLLLLALLVVASPAAWLAIKPFVWTRSLEVKLTPNATSKDLWRIDWQEWGGGAWNGRWVDLGELSDRPDALEIRLSGVCSDPGRQQFGFHLYQVTAGSAWSVSRADLKAALAQWGRDPAPLRAQGWVFEGAWIPGVGDGGGVFCSSAGRIRIPIPAEAARVGIGVETEKTVHGGDIELTFGGDATRANTHAAKWEPLKVPLRRRGVDVAGETLTLRATLPALPIADVRLRKGSPGDEAEVSPLVLHTRLFGLSLPDRTFEWSRRDELERRLTQPIKTTIPVHLLGVGIVAAGSALVWLFVFRVAIPGCGWMLRRARVAFHRWRGEQVLAVRAGRPFGGGFWFALAMISAVHLWVAMWAPVIYLPDSVDYVVNGQVMWQKLSMPLGPSESWWDHISGSFAHLGAYRLPGVSFLLVPFIAVFSRPEEAMALAQSAGGVLIAVMCYDVARRFMPRGAALIAMLLVGLDPPGLIWERHIMSEGTLTFAVVLWMWLLVRLVIAARRSSAPSWALLGWSLALGLVAGFSPLIRGNAQLLVVATPPAIVFALLGAAPLKRVAALAAVALLSSGVVVGPWALHVRAQYGRPAVFIGAGFADFAFTYIAGLADINQTRVFDAAEYESARTLANSTKDPFPLAERVNNASGLADVPGGDAWSRQDARCAIVSAESRARAGPRVLWHMWTGFVHQTARLGRSPFASTSYWGSHLFGQNIDALGDMNWEVGPQRHSLHARQPEALQRVYERTRRDVSYLKTSPNAKLFHAMFLGFDYVRMVLGVSFLAGGLIALREWNRPLLVVWGVCALTILAYCYLAYGGESRYIEPFYAPMTVLGVYALARMCQYIARPIEAGIASRY